MNVLERELHKLQRDSGFEQSLDDVDKIIQQLENAREAIVTGTYIFTLRSKPE